MAFAAPFDVRLNAEGDDDDTVVQPDITVVCDKSKLDEKGCNGAPEMVVEILSPSTGRRDNSLKYKKYRNAGVSEFWVVDPVSKTVFVHLLENGKYVDYFYGKSDRVPVHTLDGCEISLSDVFAE